MKAERIPINKMNERKEKIGSKKALVDELMGLVRAVKDNLMKNSNSQSLRELKYETNESIIGVELDKNIAQPGQYQMEVVQLAQKSSSMSSGFADPDESYIGVGFIQYTLPNGETKDVYVDSDNSSLNAIAKLVNGDSENGLNATVVNDGSGSERPWRLILSLSETGDENFAEFPYLYFIDGDEDFYLEFEREAQDAIVKLDGFEIELPANKTDTLIPGVTIDLKKAAPGEEFSLKITEDVEAISGKMGELVEQINAVLRFIHEQNALDETSDTTRTLGGDITLQSLEGRIKAAIFKDIQTEFGFKKFSDLGVRFQRDGLLKYDEGKFENSVAGNYKVVSQVLTGYFVEGKKTKGFIDNLGEVINNSMRNPDGLLPSRKRGLQQKIDQIDRRIEQKERMLQQKQKSLKDKFARLEGTISRIKSQGAGVSAMGGGGGAGLIGG